MKELTKEAKVPDEEKVETSLTIWKYEIPVEDTFVVEIPGLKQLLYVDTQNEKPYMWCVVDPAGNTTTHKFHVFGTGHPLPRELLVEYYIDSFIILNDRFVGHLFMVA